MRNIVPHLAILFHWVFKNVAWVLPKSLMETWLVRWNDLHLYDYGVLFIYESIYTSCNTYIYKHFYSNRIPCLLYSMWITIVLTKACTQKWEGTPEEREYNTGPIWESWKVPISQCVFPDTSVVKTLNMRRSGSAKHKELGKRELDIMQAASMHIIWCTIEGCYSAW